MTIDRAIADLDGRIVADNPSDLWDGTIDRTIVLDEFGSEIEEASVFGWTGTTRQGATVEGEHCERWSANPSSPTGAVGRATSTNGD